MLWLKKTFQKHHPENKLRRKYVHVQYFIVSLLTIKLKNFMPFYSKSYLKATGIIYVQSSDLWLVNSQCDVSINMSQKSF